jgi:polysaccharide deacetylase family protein (PEP-CTERM system associated)
MNIVNALTVDVEEYFQVHAFSKVIPLQKWDSIESRVKENTHKLLDLLDSCDGQSKADNRLGEKPRATFFILGWIAERHPDLIREIQSRGHEIACHGRVHESIFKQTQDEFREDVKRAKGVLEDLTGAEVIGYRAPTYSITRETIWALEIIFDLGFRYDSSIFPINHDFYGFPKAPRLPFYIDFGEVDLISQLKNPKYLHEAQNDLKTNYGKSHDSMPRGPFVEFPLSTISFMGQNLPCSGGGYFRIFPYLFTRWGIRKINRECFSPVIFYIHPWELDPGIPIIERASRLSKFRTYVNLKTTELRFKRLLEDFSFAPLNSML